MKLSEKEIKEKVNKCAEIEKRMKKVKINIKKNR